MQRMTLSVSSRAETITTGTLRSSESAFIRASTSKPFTPGIIRSSSTRSNSSACSMARASSPPVAVATRCPSPESRLASKSRLASMSSTTRMCPVSSGDTRPSPTGRLPSTKLDIVVAATAVADSRAAPSISPWEKLTIVPNCESNRSDSASSRSRSGRIRSAPMSSRSSRSISEYPFMALIGVRRSCRSDFSVEIRSSFSNSSRAVSSSSKRSTRRERSSAAVRMRSMSASMSSTPSRLASSWRICAYPARASTGACNS